jgi:predicted esterase
MATDKQGASLTNHYGEETVLFLSKIEAPSNPAASSNGEDRRANRDGARIPPMAWRGRTPCAVMLASPCLFAAQSVLAQRTAAAESLPLPRGTVIERVECAAAPGQSYALYLPSAYAADRRWPVLYAFDPGAQGARPVRLAVAAAERFGWIVAGSNNSRNGPAAGIRTAVAALVEDVSSRLAIDPRRVYATGLSGGARVAAGLALGSRGGVAGVFAQSAGLPVDVPASRVTLAFAWFASAGERDMNYGELFDLERELERRGVRQRLRVFDGGHEWAPSAVWVEAISWFELLAMNDGLRPRDATLTAALFEAASARAAAFRERGELLDESRELESIARDFDGLADTAGARRRLAELRASSAYAKALARERSAVDEQAHAASELQRDVAQLGDPSSEEHAAHVLQATRDANELARRLASAKPAERLVYERALTQAYVGTMEAAHGALRRRQPEAALDLFAVAATLRREAAGPLVGRAQAEAVAGRKAEAVRALRRAVELGLQPSELARLVESSDELAGLRGDADLLALVNASAQP